MNSYISIKVRSEDLGKTIEFKNEMLPGGPLYKGGGEKDNVFRVKIEKEYLVVHYYYPDKDASEVSKTLRRVFNKYEKVVDLIIGGDLTYIGGYFVRCHTTNIIPPLQTDALPECSTNPSFLFADDRWLQSGEGGEWVRIGD